MHDSPWSTFYTATKNNPPRRRLLRAMALLGRCGEALDLGCGAGRDTRHLVDQGFLVTAVDREALSLEMLADLPASRLYRVQSDFKQFSFGQYDLIVAHFALPFIEQEEFSRVFERLKAALKPGAIFTGQFFGIKDSWNTPDTRMTFFTSQQAQEQLEGLEILTFEEEERDAIATDGMPKHWHVYHIIARKPS